MSWTRAIPFMGPKWFVRDLVTRLDGTKFETDSRLLYSMIRVFFDMNQQRLRWGIQSRMTQLAPPDALQWIGKGLDIIRGPNESIDAYRARLLTGIDDKRLTGIAWPMLRQIRGYCSPYAVRVRLVNEHGHWYTIDRDGTQSTYRYSAWNWDNARANAIANGTVRTRANGHVGPAIPWARFWLVIYPTTDTVPQPWQRDGTWGHGKVWGDDGTTWGSTATPGDVSAIQRIARRWKPMGSRCVGIAICFSDTDFDPTTTAPPLPDGTWGQPGKYTAAAPGICVAARSANAIYWPGSSGSPNTTESVKGSGNYL